MTPIAVLCATGRVSARVDRRAGRHADLVGGTGCHPEFIAKVSARTKSPKPERTGLLFNMEDKNVEPHTLVAKVPVESGWIAAIIRSPIFEQQKKLAGRSVPPERSCGRCSVRWNNAADTMTSAAIARAVNYPPMRLRGFLAVMQRVLNIDGFAVLTRDEASDTVDLNRELLKRRVRPEVETVTSISPQRRDQIIDALRGGPFPRAALMRSPLGWIVSRPPSTAS